MNKKISINPSIHFGKSCVAGTRITVENVLELIDEGVSFEEIKKDWYPDLKTEDLKDCVDYSVK